MGKVLDKVLSARFLMAIIVTIAGCGLTAYICHKFLVDNKELVTFVVGQFFFIWKDICKDYFQRTDRASEQTTTATQTVTTPKLEVKDVANGTN